MPDEYEDTYGWCPYPEVLHNRGAALVCLTSPCSTPYEYTRCDVCRKEFLSFFASKYHPPYQNLCVSF